MRIPEIKLHRLFKAVLLMVLFLPIIASSRSWEDEPDYTIDDIKSQWMDFTGKTIILQAATRGEINQISKEVWEVNLWHKGENLYCQFGRALLQNMKDIFLFEDNKEDIACFYLRGTISEKEVSNNFGVKKMGPCFTIIKRLK